MGTQPALCLRRVTSAATISYGLSYAGLALSVVACGPPPAPEPAKTRQRATSEPAVTQVREQLSYCKRLQPILDKTATAAEIGSKLTCLDLPGVTGLGRFGPSAAAEEDALEGCFDEPDEYAALIERGAGTFQLGIDEDFEAGLGQGGSLGLGALVPWLPELRAKNTGEERVSARVVLRDAHFETLLGVASKLQGQVAEERCLRALCSENYSYVHKVLLGTPEVVLSTDGSRTTELGLRLGAGELEFEEKHLSSGALRVTSKVPLTLAVARSSFRTAQTERLCQFCGKQGQACCGEAPACDGGLGCSGGHCVTVGGPGEPCDQGRCRPGASCVGTTCRAECGGHGQPCCAQKSCSGKLSCKANPENARETSVFSTHLVEKGGLFGTNEDRVLSVSSCGDLNKRKRFAISKVGGGRGDCERAWWFDPKNSQDCRVGVHVNVSTLGSVECRLEVYATPPPKPDICSR